jgi:hypothetical protein
LWLRGDPVSANTRAFDECPLARAAAKKEGSFAKETGDVRRAVALRGCDFFYLFFAAVAEFAVAGALATKAATKDKLSADVSMIHFNL